MRERLFFYSIRSKDNTFGSFWQPIYDACGDAGRFHLDIARRIGISRFIPRDGEWSLPWPCDVVPGFEMPEYVPDFPMGFGEICDAKALELRAQIHAGKRFALMYSGGMDSTCILVSLLKNLNADELHSLAIVANPHSVIEYPFLWHRHIARRLKVFHSDFMHYDDLLKEGYTPITGDEGDCIFGTNIGIEFYRFCGSEALPESPYAKFKDALIRYFSLDDSAYGKRFGELFYLKLERLAQTAKVPIYSLHDFFWWMIFNPKYMNCSLRGAVYFQHELGVKDCLSGMVNWYNDSRYQQWSMANNNNGQKIRTGSASYKHAAREYIHAFTGDDWYFKYKSKLESLKNVSRVEKERSDVIAVLVDGYRKGRTTEPVLREFLQEGLQSYAIDWA